MAAIGHNQTFMVGEKLETPSMNKRRAQPIPQKKSWLSLAVASISMWIVMVGSVVMYTSGAVLKSAVGWVAMLLLLPFSVWVGSRELFSKSKDKTKLGE